jgi:small subunit ribosomal protein S18
MARNPKATKKQSQGPRAQMKAAGRRGGRGRPKFCIFCRERATWVDYKDVSLLNRFVNDRGRMKARAATGNCAQHQRDVATAIKTARELALLPYSVRTAMTEGRGGRGGDRRITNAAAAAPDAQESETAQPADESEEETTAEPLEEETETTVGAPA